MAVGYDRLVKKNYTVDDTLDLIIKAANDESKSPFVKSIVEKFSPINDRETFLRQIFDYYCRNVKYKLDEGKIETVWTAARIIDEGIGDCKKAATFLCAVLTAAKIPAILKHVYYSPDNKFTHIYVIVPNPDTENYITLDPTNDCMYDSEVSYDTATLYFLNGNKMARELRMMGNPNNRNNGMSLLDETMNIGATNSFSKSSFLNNIPAKAQATPQYQQVKTAIDSGEEPHKAVVNAFTDNSAVKNFLQNVPLEKQRGAFLTLVQNNVNGIATTLAQALAIKSDALNDTWALFGGDITTLKQAIIDGAKNNTTSISGFLDTLAGIGNAIIGVAGPIIDTVLPGAGLVFSGISAAWDALSPSPTPQQVGTYPSDNTGYYGTPGYPPSYPPYPPAPVSGSVMGSVGGFIFKSLLLINFHTPFYIDNSFIRGMIGLTVISGGLIYFGYKKMIHE